MNEFPLAELVKARSQADVAKGLGCSGPAIKKAIDQGRKITVIVNDDGTLTGQEIKPFPSQVKDAAET
ncbi:Regulatory protein Cro [Ectopseudomonas oleovorans]|nr:Regulatory protein Cro [Pseudomonas oleovorans]